MSPGELLLYQVARLERLHRLDDMEIWNVLELGMLGGVEVLLGDQDAFLEQMLVDGYAMGFWHKHDCWKWKRLRLELLFVDIFGLGSSGS